MMVLSFEVQSSKLFPSWRALLPHNFAAFQNLLDLESRLVQAPALDTIAVLDQEICFELRHRLSQTLQF